jgi:nitronate monooxygenase
MGVGVSNWRLARAVSKAGQLGVVSGTFLDTVFARRLQDGDPGGCMRTACNHFPDQKMAERVFARYYIKGGKEPSKPYRSVPMFTIDPPTELIELTVLANFVEVFLAKHGHDGPVGINFLEVIQLPLLPSLYGAMLAGVDYVLIGAGIPRAVPAVLDKLSMCEPVSYRIDVDTSGADKQEDAYITFDPRQLLPNIHFLQRPKFLAIVSSHTLAMNLARKASSRVDGFVVENHTAGGHNAPPRGQLQVDENGEPIYGDRDNANLEEIARLGLPFWLAGSFASPDKLAEAQAAGAAGIQVGTAFAYCEESGITEEIKEKVLEMVGDGSAFVHTDPIASSCGYPFKVVQLPGSLSEQEVYESRRRVCDLGYLRSAYRRKDGSMGYRCPGEPEADYVRKGGAIEDTDGRKCLCNGLLSTIGLAQSRSGGYSEPSLVTSGQSLVSVLRRFLKPGSKTYSARDVVEHILCQTRQLSSV